MQKQLKQTIHTVEEMDRHVLRCRRDVDGLFMTWSENITEEYTQKFNEKATEFGDKMRKFDQTLETKCEQAGHTAAAYMDEVVEKHNANIQQVNEQLREQLARLEKTVDEKVDSTEAVTLATEQSALRKRLANFQQEHKNLYEKRGQDLAQVMLDQESLFAWVKKVQQDHDAIVLRCEADAKDRRVLDRHLRILEQQPRINQFTGQATISVPSREQSASRDAENGGCRQSEAKMAELVKKLEEYESRLNKLEDGTKHTSPCQRCVGALRVVKKDLKSSKEALKKEKLESQKRLADHRDLAKAQYQALEQKYNNLTGLVGELPTLPVYWQMVARLENLEQDKRWNDRVRRLETFGAATPEPVLRHLEYLESRLDTVLYDREVPLPNAVARGRIVWAWEALEKASRTEPHQAVPAQILPLPAVIHHQQTQQQTQQPQKVRLEASSQQISQDEVLAEPTAQVEAISQPICAGEVVLQSTAYQRSQEETSSMEICQQMGSPKSSSPQDEVQVPTTTVVDHGETDQTISHPPSAQSFGFNLVPSFQAPPVDVPSIDWSASVSVDLSRDASEFDIDDASRTKAPKDKLTTRSADGDIHSKESITTGSSESGTSNSSMATSPPAYPNGEGSTQVAIASEQPQEPVSGEHKASSLDAPLKAGIQSPFSVIPTKSSGEYQLTTPGLEPQNHHISQPLYGGAASSAYTTVCGTQSITHSMVSPTSTQPPPIPCISNGFTSYDPTKPSPTNPHNQPKAMFGPSETSKQHQPRSLTSSSSVNYKPAQPYPTNPGIHPIQPMANTGIGPGVAHLVPAVKPHVHDTCSETDSDDEGSDFQPRPVSTTGSNTGARIVIQKPRGRLNRMTDEQRSAIRLEMDLQKPGVDSMQELPPIIPWPPTPAMPTQALVQKTGTSSAQNKDAVSSKAPSASTTVYDREDAVDYGDTDDDSPGPLKPPAEVSPTPKVPARAMRRYTTQWLKIWRSHVVSEKNIRMFAETNGFKASADKWMAIVENANADTKPQDVLVQANIAVHRQLYSGDDINKIADAFFEVCLVQSGSFQSAIEGFDPFHMANYHMSFLDAFKEYLKNHPADSY